MTESKQDYVPPAIIFEADIETNAGPSPINSYYLWIP